MRTNDVERQMTHRQNFYLLAVFIFFTFGCAGSPHLEDYSGSSTININEPGPGAPTPTPTVPGVVQRDVEFTSNSNENRPTIKVVLVVDNSRSMKDEQTKLASGVESLIEGLKTEKANVDFYVYTTSSDSADKPVSTVQSKYVTVNQGTEIFSLTRPPAAAPLAHSKRDIWNLNPKRTMTGSVANALSLKMDDTNARYDTVKANLKTLIQSIGVAGSDSEQGICVLGRLLAEQKQTGVASNAIFSPGDYTAFAVISDSDDVSDLSTCLKQQDTNFSISLPVTTGNIRTTNRSEAARWDYQPFYWKATTPEFNMNFSYATNAIEDGQTRPTTVEGNIRFTPANFESLFGQYPIPQDYLACTSAMRDYVRARYPTYVPGTHTCRYRSYYNYDQKTYGNQYQDSETPLLDRCTQAALYGGVSYSTVSEYVRSLHSAELTGYSAFYCWNQGVTPYISGSVTNIKIANLLHPGISTLEQGITSKANELFGDNGFMFSALIDPNGDSTCSSSSIPTEMKGTKYQAFANSLGNKGSVHSVCQSDYYPALRGIHDFIVRVMVVAYQVALEEGETIKSVNILRGGATISAAIGSDVVVQGPSLHFRDNFLQLNDRISVKLEKIL